MSERKCGEYIKNIKCFVMENYRDSELTVDGIAEAFGYNSRYLTRVFKGECGITVYTYIHECRIAAAKEMLRKNLSVKDISEAVGYTNMRSFNRIFFKITGMSPTEYKNMIMI